MALVRPLTAFVSILASIAASSALLVPSSARAQFVKAPIAIENATWTPLGGSAQPVPPPITATIATPPGCGVGNGGTLFVEVVNNGIEVTFEGAAYGCSIESGTLRFDVLLDVPVVSEDAAAFLYLVPEVVGTNFVNSPWQPPAEGTARLHFIPRPGTSSEASAPFDANFPSVAFDWSVGTSTTLELSGMTRLLPMFPGDAMRFPAEVSVRLESPAGGGSLTGTFTTRFEFRTRLPLPVSALPSTMSIPIGVIGLAGLAALRG